MRQDGSDVTAWASFAQRRLWIIDRLNVATSGYNIGITLRLAGTIDVAILEAALAFVLRRHATLRTCLRDLNGEPVQHVLPAEAMPLARVPVAPADRAARIASERIRPIDLAVGPLLRASLLEAPGTDPVLLLVIHHAAFDGWSVPILLDDLAAAYRAGGAARLPELPTSYAAYARDQRSRPADAAALDYWRRRVSGLEELPLPYDRPPGTQPPQRAISLPVQLTTPVRDRLDTLARAANTTVFTVLLAAFQAWLHRISGADRVATGIPIAGREHAALEPLVGLFVNLLVIDARFDDGPTFRTLIDRVQDAVLGAMDHRDLPFDQLAQSLGSARQSGRNPLFNVAFALQQAPAAPDFGPDVTAGVPALQAGVRFDLELYLWRDGAGLTGTLIADADCFTAGSLATLRQSFLVMLARLLGAPDAPVGRHELLSSDARRTVLAAARPLPRSLPAQRIETVFAAQVARDPTAPAVVDGGGIMTYAMLDALADSIAGGLRARGVRAGNIVAVFAERSGATIAALIAILRCGAAYLPLDPGQPPERLAAMLDEARPALTIGDRPEPGLPCVTFDALAEGGPRAGVPALASESIAYINYTSGSTGRPKGIAIPHRAVLRLALEQSYLTLGPGRRVGHAASLAFDAVTFEIWSPLLAGAAVVVLPRSSVLDSALLAGAIRQHAIDTLFVTTAVFNQLVDSAPDVLPRLDTLLFGGEACDPARVRRVLAQPPGRLLHVYGPTESTTFASWHAIQELPPGSDDVPIGKALDNTSLYVLDAQGTPVAPGGSGELHIGGAGLALFYLGDPARTAGRFVPDALSGEAGARLYRTGDRVRLNADGSISFLGRIDRQVKIRGRRIEPGEVEAALGRLPGIRNAAVLVHQADDGERMLVAYVAGEDLPPPAALRQQLRASLPDWMLPTIIVSLPRLPLTTNGKLDRRALPAPQESSDTAMAAPDDLLEAEVALLAGEILGLPAIAPDADLFALGAHSLSMTRLAARLRAHFAIELPLAPLFEAPTVADIAQAVYAAMTAAHGGADAGSIAAAPRRHAPLSFAQGRLWFLDRLGLTGTAYHSPFSLQLDGALDPMALRQAVDGLSARHAVLRTVFEEHEGQPRQHIHETASVPIVFADLSMLSGAAQDAALRERIDGFIAAPFNLESDPPLRLGLLRLAAARHVLTLVFHHIAFDGWSLPVVARDLSALYGAATDGRRAVLPPLPVQYADYAIWQRDWLDGPRTQALLDRWCERLAGITDLDLPTDFARPSIQRHEGGTCRIRWPRDLSDALADFARDARTTPYIVLLAGFAALLHRYTGQERIVVGAPIANRNREEVQDLIGFFVNSLVLATDCSGDPDFNVLLARVRETALDAYALQELPFERLVEALRPQRDLSRHPLFQIVFALQQSDAMNPRFDLPGITAALVPVGEVAVRFDLELHLTQTAEGIGGYAFFDRGLFEQASIERLLEQYQTLMTALIDNPDRPVSAAPLESEAALDEIEAWSRA